MSTNLRYISFFAVVVVFVAAFSLSNLISQTKSRPQPFQVELSDTVTHYQQIFAGPPLTASMHSGLVVLAPSTSVGKHSTGGYEEAVIVLSGTGEMKIDGGQTFKLGARSVAYCPPGTVHDVLNTGSKPLRYLYLVARPR